MAKNILHPSSFILHLSSLIFLLVATSSYAAKSSGAVRTFTQPDGTVISVRLLGDEHFSWYQTTDGVLLTHHGNAFYIGTVTGSGILENSGIIAHNDKARSLEEQAAISKQDKTKFFSQAEKEVAKSRKAMGSGVTSIEGYPSPSFCPHSGVVKVPIILMNYTDTVFRIGKTDEEIRAAFDTYYNGTERTPWVEGSNNFNGYSSVKQYFLDASYGALQFEFDVYGPYTTSHGHDYYGNNSGRRDTLLVEAVAKAGSDINFDNYVQEGYDYVNMVCVMYAGAGANISGKKTDFWPACYFNQNIGTKGQHKVNTICGFPELAFYPYQSEGMTVRAGIGVTCHEMSHGMGLPDLYYDFGDAVKNNNNGPEDWDLMDGGENLYNGTWPCQMSAWEAEILGWKEAIELTEETDVTLYPLNKENGELYKVVNPDNKNEWYIIEAYQNDEWNYYVNSQYGSGLMIMHINTYAGGSSTALSMKPNTTAGKPNVTILPADGFILSSYNMGKTFVYQGKEQTITQDMFSNDLKGDPYPGTSNVTSLAAYNNYTGEEMINKYPITDITKNSDGSMSFKFMGGKTAIKAISESVQPTDYRIYTLDGRFVGNSLQALPHGMYIVGGKKIIK